jgi:hypothetical protein
MQIEGAPFFCGGLALLAILGLYLSHRSNRRRRLIEALPTSATQGIFIGLVELKGTAECEHPVTSFLTEQRCVLYSWTIHEHWRREIEETYTDNEGNRRRRTRVESGSICVGQGGETTPFYLQDESGVVLVHPEGAEQRPLSLLARTCTSHDPLYFGKGPLGTVPNSTMTRTFVETGIPLHTMLFLVGKARERGDVVAPEIAAEKDAPLYLMTTQTEAQVLSGYRLNLGLWAFVGLAAAAGCGALIMDILHLGSQSAMIMGAIAGGAIYLGLAALSWIWMVFNSLVDTRNRVRLGWSQLDVQLQRRHDLIPNLVACVEAVASHEKETQATIAKLRQQMTATAPGIAGEDFRGVARDVLVLAERYPQLRAQESFANLQTELIGTEQRIALARAYFNDIATAYNNRLEVVPDRFIASLTGFRRQPLLMAEDFERATVSINLAS